MKKQLISLSPSGSGGGGGGGSKKYLHQVVFDYKVTGQVTMTIYGANTSFISSSPTPITDRTSFIERTEGQEIIITSGSGHYNGKGFILTNTAMGGTDNIILANRIVGYNMTDDVVVVDNYFSYSVSSNDFTIRKDEVIEL